jgi:hypothetical protein
MADHGGSVLRAYFYSSLGGTLILRNAILLVRPLDSCVEYRMVKPISVAPGL